MVQSPGKTKSFLVASLVSYCQLSASHGPEAMSPVSLKMLQLQPNPALQRASIPLQASGKRQACVSLVDHIARG